MEHDYLLSPKYIYRVIKCEYQDMSSGKLKYTQSCIANFHSNDEAEQTLVNMGCVQNTKHSSQFRDKENFNIVYYIHAELTSCFGDWIHFIFEPAKDGWV